MNLTESEFESGIIDKFGVINLLVFLLTLSISSGIGIYYGFFHGKDSIKTTEDYLLGGRRMKMFPIAVSLMASQISGIAIIAIPAEIYFFGTQFWVGVPSIGLGVLLINTVFLPVFYNNNISSCYEYLEARYSKMMRKVITLVFLLTYSIYLPIVIYIPALAFAQLSGLNVQLINLVVTSICIMYTMLGGIKAVVLTDVFQFTIMMISCITVTIVAMNRVGGLSKVWELANDGQRLEFFNLTPDLTIRNTFWNAVLGNATMWASYMGLNQSCVQRIVSLPTLNHAKRAMWIFFIGCFVIATLNCYIGVVMFSNYIDCDPMQAGIVDKADKMIPYFIQNIVGHLIGIPGLFISCVFSAALSTMSATMNTLSAVYYYDYIRKLKLFEHNDSNAKLAMRVLVIIIGIYSVLMGFVVSKFKYILQLFMSVNGVTQGTILGVFLLGMLFPKSNNTGALAGTFSSIIGCGFLVIVTQIKTFSGEIISKTLPASIEGCTKMGINVTNIITNTLATSETLIQDDESFSIFKISFLWYTVIGTVLCLAVGIIVSSCFGGPDYTNLHSRLFPPCIQWLLPKEIIEKSIEMKIIESVAVVQPLLVEPIVNCKNNKNVK